MWESSSFIPNKITNTTKRFKLLLGSAHILADDYNCSKYALSYIK